MKKTIQLVPFIWVICAVCSGAEDPEPDLTVIRVTAQRFENTAMSVPADVVVIPAETIQQSQAGSVPELLQQKANLHIRSSNGKSNTGEISMRGFGENSGLRVLVIVDGQKMNRADMGLLDWQQLPLETIQSIEVIRGGQTVLYGNHALSGVIKITTKKGGAQATRLKASAGSYGFQDYSLFHSGSCSDLFYTAGATVQRDEGFRDNSLSWTKNVNASLGTPLGDSDLLTAKVLFGENYIELPGPLSYDKYRDNPKQSVHSGDVLQTTNLLVTALWEGERDWGNAQAGAGFNLRDMTFEMNGLSGENRQQGVSFAPQTRVGNEQNFVSGGFDLFYDTIQFHGDQGATFNDAKLNRITAGPFLFAQKEMTQTLRLSGGARYECACTWGENRQYNKADFEPFLPNPWGPPIPNPNYPPKPVPDTFFDGSVNKKGWAHELSLNWQPVESFSSWIGYDRVYRYPALDEVASYQGYPSIIAFNTKLDPETGNHFETGVKHHSNNWIASATLFYLALDNEIGYDDIQKLNVNLGATEHLGSDLTLSYDKEQYGASTMLSWVLATFDGGPNDGKTVPLVPELQNSSELWFRLVQPLRLSATCIWTSRQVQGGDVTNEQQDRLSSYALFGLNANYQIGKHLTLFAKIDNLTDKPYASSAYNGQYYPGQGRSFYAGAALEF